MNGYPVMPGIFLRLIYGAIAEFYYLRGRKFFNMINRRNIRVKVMQVLYATGVTGGEKSVDLLRKRLDDSHTLFLYLLYFLAEVARYAEKDAANRASKNLPSKEDLEVNTKIAGNELLWKILEDPYFKKSTEKFDIVYPAGESLIKKIYRELVETELYQTYIGEPSRNKAKEKEIIKFIFTDLILPNEDVHTLLEEYFTNWEDDAEMMYQLIVSYLQKPGSFSIEEFIDTDKWTFAQSLLNTVIEKNDFLKGLIISKLKNWDVERLAQLDMILLQMGVSEFLFFETIPTKVTINEYIDLAKEYSTPQSGHFINGILDNIHKELLASQKIQKVAFKSGPVS